MTPESIKQAREIIATIPKPKGCSDGGCLVEIPTGMHTNGGCKCFYRLDHYQRMFFVAARTQWPAALDEIERLSKTSYYDEYSVTLDKLLAAEQEVKNLQSRIIAFEEMQKMFESVKQERDRLAEENSHFRQEFRFALKELQASAAERDRLQALIAEMENQRIKIGECNIEKSEVVSSGFESLCEERDRLAGVVFSHEKWIEQLQSTVKTMRDNLLSRSQMGKVIELEDQLQASAAREKILVEALEWYGEPRRYNKKLIVNNDSDERGEIPFRHETTAIEIDGGARARAALERKNE